MTWEEYFFFLQQKHVFGVALARINKSKCLKKISQSRKKTKNIECFFFFEVAYSFSCSKAACALACHYSSVVLPNAQNSRVLLVTCTDKSERTSDLPGGRKEDLKTSFAFESFHLFLLNAQSRCLYKLEA